MQAGAAATMFALGVLAWTAGQWGAGDAKLLGATVLWLTPQQWGLYAWGLAAVSAGMVCVALLPHPVPGRWRRSMPFATAIAAPALWLLAPWPRS